MNRNRLIKKTAILKNGSTVVVAKCYVADSVGDRILGLMFERQLSSDEGLYLAPCNSIHTFFMKFPIDAVYLDGEGKVMTVQRNIKPWRIAMPVFGAHAVLEVNSGRAENIKVGEYVCLN